MTSASTTSGSPSRRAAAVEVVEPPGRAKELADELEVLEAVRAAATTVPPATVDDAMNMLAGVAAEALSCELGIVYLADGDASASSNAAGRSRAHRRARGRAGKCSRAAGSFRHCVQDAKVAPLPGVLAAEPGIRSYYLLELTGLARGVLLVAHTDAAPRGFTLLCRRLGARLAEIGSASLGVVLTREWISAEAVRLQSAFAELER